MRKKYKYIDHRGNEQQVPFNQLPPLAKAMHAKEDRKKRYKRNKERREREVKALTLSNKGSS